MDDGLLAGRWLPARDCAATAEDATSLPEAATAGRSRRQGVQDALQLIRGWKWFAYVPVEGQQWLAARAQIRQLEKGRQLYAPGEAITHVYGVVSGVFRIFLTSWSGEEVTLEEVVRGAWFPHCRPLDTPRHALSCVCQSDAVVAALPQAVLAEFARRWPGYYQGLYDELNNRSAATFGRIELLSLHNLNVRLSVYLLLLARLRGRHDADGSVWVAAQECQSEIGARVGGTRQRINILLKAWARESVIELHKDGTRILDLPRLSAEAKNSGFDLDGYLGSWHGGWEGAD